MSGRQSRPSSAYGRKGTAKQEKEASRQRDKSPHEQRNIETEYKLNKALSLKEKGGKKGRGEFLAPNDAHHHHHRGDENLSDDDMANSMPERMMRLNVKGASSSGGGGSPLGSPHRRSFDGGLNFTGDTSPVLIRSNTVQGDRRTNKAEISNAKLSMMRRKLQPLPSRNEMGHSRETSPSPRERDR